jgi:hypothetical protein
MNSSEYSLRLDESDAYTVRLEKNWEHDATGFS